MKTVTNKLTIAPSPHVRDQVTTASIMQTVLLALAPAAVASVVIFGVKALILMVTCVVTCVAAEYLFDKANHKANTITDFSAVVTGLLLAFNLPSTLPPWMAVVGCLAAIIVAKQLFGGIGQNFANPAIVGRIVLLISFTQPMTNWLIPKKVIGGYELVSGATPLALNASGLVEQIPDYLQMFIGQRGGCLGETCIAALLVGGLFLIFKGIISPIIPVAYLGTVAVFAVLVGEDPVFYLLAGGVVLGAFFMATDYVTSPVTDKGKLIFGIGCGLLTMLIRIYASYPEGTSFAILLMNILTPHIDNFTKMKPFGAGGAK